MDHQVNTLSRTNDDSASLDGLAAANDGERANFAIRSADRHQFGWSCRLSDGNFHWRGFFAHHPRRRPAIDSNWRCRMLGRLIGALDFHRSLEHAVAGIDAERRQAAEIIRGGSTRSGNVAGGRRLRSGRRSGEQQPYQQGDSWGDPTRTVKHGISPFASWPDHENASRALHGRSILRSLPAWRRESRLCGPGRLAGQSGMVRVQRTDAVETKGNRRHTLPLPAEWSGPSVPTHSRRSASLHHNFIISAKESFCINFF